MVSDKLVFYLEMYYEFYFNDNSSFLDLVEFKSLLNANAYSFLLEGILTLKGHAILVSNH